MIATLAGKARSGSLSIKLTHHLVSASGDSPRNRGPWPGTSAALFDARAIFARGGVVLWLAVFALSVVPAWAADAVTGTVRNMTISKPAVGDEVILLRLTQGMLRETATTTDAHGRFKLKLAFPQASYLIRVVHQGVNYEQPVIPEVPVTVNVFDAVSGVKALHGSIALIQLVPNGNMLDATAVYAIENNFTPPRTQTSLHNFDFQLPPDAELIKVMVAAPATTTGIGIKPLPVKGEANHYIVDFSLKPGQTRYFIKYQLPYPGRITLHPRLPYAFEQFGVIIPESMTFNPLRQNSFHDGDHIGALRLHAMSNIKAGEVPGFEIADAGLIPNGNFSDRGSPHQNPTIPAGASNNKAVTSATSAHTPNVAIWGMVIGCGVLAIICILAIRTRRKNTHDVAANLNGTNTVSALLEALREQLLQLEHEHMRGTISEEQYVMLKEGVRYEIQRIEGKNPPERPSLA